MGGSNEAENQNTRTDVLAPDIVELTRGRLFAFANSEDHCPDAMPEFLSKSFCIFPHYVVVLPCVEVQVGHFILAAGPNNR
jgi:hypothetical protein